MPWPDWWDWELELMPHLEKRMEDPDFTEVDLRAMSEQAGGHHVDVVEGRWMIETRHRRHRWHVIVEPDPVEAAPGILVDYAGSGEPIGLEITSPAHVTVEQINAVLAPLGVASMTPEEFAPLRAA